ncbi:trehalose-phosphatase [Roseixanthobacter glucoisosaccharinicivorans]|uniref:trehalose-phosphatase n=1 Tax=Roseixanthobacter glucoisosaccharinicivorans TaxID=3119923 RepID=UPI00372A77D1
MATFTPGFSASALAGSGQHEVGGEAVSGPGVEALMDRLDPARCAFFFDVDGTLIDIASHPDAVVVPPRLLEDLSALQARSDGALALVSGRAIANLDRLFAPLRLAASGIHGAETRTQPGQEIQASVMPLPTDVRETLASIADDLDGVMAEDKGSSVAMHYRAAPSIGPVLEGLVHALVDQSFGRLVVLPGRFVFEVKQAGHDKGLAIRAFMNVPQFAGRTPVFLGDDVTDQAGFAAVSALGGVAVSVGRRFPGVHAVLPEPEDVRALIATLAANPIERRN